MQTYTVISKRWQTVVPAALLTAARLKAGYRISLGDAMIASFALRRGAVLLHKDPEFEPLAVEFQRAGMSLDALPYKTS